MKTKIITLLTTLAISSFSMAQIINVPVDQPTIQAGIDAAVDGDTVLVDTGTYYENINFIGKAITVASNYIMSGDTNHINNTEIDGSQPANPDSASVVTFNSGEDTTSVICGFTITGGAGTSMPGTNRFGGGIMCYYSSATIIHNKIINNTASSNNLAIGGGIYCKNNSQLISNNVISHNSLSGQNTYGGGIYLSNSDYTEMTGNIITSNILNMIDVGSGAGVFCTYPLGPLNVFQNEFSYNIGGQTVFNSGSGGGLFIWDAYDYPVVVDGNRFLYNSVWFGGGFYEKNSYNLKLTNNVFIGNDTYRGGAVGIWHEDGSNNYRPRFINNTFFNNSASEFGDAITYYGDFNGCSPIIINCIFWENAGPPFWEEITNLSSDTVLVFNSNISIEAIYGPYYGKNNFDEDPEFEADSIHLQESSPCIDVGLDSIVIDGTTYYSPEIDFDGDLRSLPDVGADEYISPGVGTPEIMNDGLALKIYPNPASNSISLVLQPGIELTSLEIINIQGKVVMHHKVTDHKQSFNISHFPKGLYFIQIHTSKGIEVKKLVIQ